jgi:hypothetical protein
MSAYVIVFSEAYAYDTACLEHGVFLNKTDAEALVNKLNKKYPPFHIGTRGCDYFFVEEVSLHAGFASIFS